ncbi:MAG TPA: thermonuclease family protein [Saprospiraceae bacterium]|nr:thermonuclease family protein [Saprospiraceae bacterium]
MKEKFSGLFFSDNYIYYLIIFAFTIYSCRNQDKLDAPNNNKDVAFFISGIDTIDNYKKCGVKTTGIYKIKKLVDGDTFWLDDGCDGVKVRLIGIDAPESRNMFGTIHQEPYGKEASAFMEQLVIGKSISVKFDVDSLDQYGRTLAYCFTDDGIFINKKMIEEGMAMIMTVVPNVKYQDVFYEAQFKARESKKGMWSE